MKRLSARQAQLQLHEIHSRDFLGDRVFDLKPCIRLDEVVVRSVHEKLEGAQIAVAGDLREARGRRGDPDPDGVRQPRRRSDLHHLLVTPLQRTVPVTQAGHGPGGVGGDLDFYVAGSADELLHENVGDAERRPCFGLRASERLLKFSWCGHHPDPPATAAADCLHEHGGTGGEPGKKVPGLCNPHSFGDSGNDRHFEFLSQSASTGLVPEEFERRGAGADENEALALAAARERRVLAEEPVSGVNRVATRPARQCNDLFRVQIGARPLAVQRLRRVGAAHVQGTAVVLGIDGHGLDAAIRGRGRNPDCDLAAIGYEQLPHLAFSSGSLGLVPITPSRSSSSISASSRPRIPPSTSQLCCPRVGDGQWILMGSPSIRYAASACGSSPVCSRSTSFQNPRAFKWGSRHSSFERLTDPAGTPAACSSAIAASARRSDVHPDTTASRSSWRASRSFRIPNPARGSPTTPCKPFHCSSFRIWITTHLPARQG